MTDKPLRVIVCGSRTWVDEEAVWRELCVLPRGSTIVHGAARGADEIAGRLAALNGLQQEAHPADWSKGRGAGIARNAEMAAAGADRAIAFWCDQTPGTRDMIARCAQAKIPTRIVTAGPVDLVALLAEQVEWSGRTFGPGPRTESEVKHIQKELAEIRASPGSVEEWIDVAILALDGAWRCGPHSAREVVDALLEKLARNRARRWATGADGVTEHVREER